MKQLTKSQAIKFYHHKLYIYMTENERAEFQLNQKLLCIPMDVFHAAVTETFQRSVYSHEFGCQQVLLKELYNIKEPLPFCCLVIGIPKTKLELVMDAK